MPDTLDAMPPPTAFVFTDGDCVEVGTSTVNVAADGTDDFAGVAEVEDAGVAGVFPFGACVPGTFLPKYGTGAPATAAVAGCAVNVVNNIAAAAIHDTTARLRRARQFDARTIMEDLDPLGIRIGEKRQTSTG